MGKDKHNLILTAKDAKARAFEHWKYLEGLAQRRFPRDENLGHEALLYILQQLEAGQWQRIRCWKGQGRFISYLTVVANRLLTDFSRKHYGHVRKPAWLAKKQDPFWDQAYHLLKVQKNSRVESIEILCCSQPQRTRGFIEDVVATILEKCTDATCYGEENLSLEVCTEQGTTQTVPEKQLNLGEKDLLEILLQFLNKNSTDALPEYIIDPLESLRSCMTLGEEDRLFLQLRYLDGFNMKSIVKVMNLQGDPYKRSHKLINELQKCCRQVGLIKVDSVAF